MTDWGDPNLPPGVTQDQLDMDYGDICACGHRDHEHYDDEDVENNSDLKVGVCDITGCDCEEYQVETKLGWLHPINIHNICEEIRADKEANPEKYKDCNKVNQL